MVVMTNMKLRQQAIMVAENCKTLYVLGCFGAPMTPANKARYEGSYAYNRKPERKKKIDAAAADVFGFDCVCFLKGLLWGFCADKNDIYGGAVYKSNGVPDFGSDGENGVMKYCSGVSSDFRNIQIGEILHKDGHVGIYIGDGLAAECTSSWKDGVQITAVLNIAAKAGYNGTQWSEHGKLRYIDYNSVNPAPAPNPDKTTFTVDTVRNGSKGSSVLLCQKLLKVSGYKGSNGKVLALDSDCGANTVYAIKNFQKDMKLDQDGICGKNTWKALLGL